MHSSEMVVVGAGIIGASVAWRLAQAGLQVALVDSGRLGGEASWAGAGMLAPGGEIRERTPWTDFALASLRQYPAFVAELREESGCAIGFRAEGALEVAWNDAELADLAVRSNAQQALGIASVGLSTGELRRRAALVAAEAAGGLWFPEDALVDPRDVMQALRACLLRRGVRLREGCAVEEIAAAAGRVRVTCAGGESLEAGGAVLAAGAWSSRIRVTVEGSPQALPASFPVRGHLLGYRLPPTSLPAILRHGHTYIVQRDSGFTIAGSSEEQVGFERTPNHALVADIRARACRLVPALADAGEPEVWLGFRPGIAGGIPCLEPLPGVPVWPAYGHYRNGILLAPATAERVARSVISSWGTDSRSHAGSR